MPPAFPKLVRGRPAPLPLPVESMYALGSPAKRAHVGRMTLFSAVGTPATVRQPLAAIVAATAANELILTSQLFDPAERRKSQERITGLQSAE